MIITKIRQWRMIAAALMFLSLSGHSAVITQDVFIDVTQADVGNTFGVDNGFSGLFGTLSYESDVVFTDFFTLFDNPNFQFSFNIGSLFLSQLDDMNVLAVLNPANPDPTAGVFGLFMTFDNGAEFGSILLDSFEAFDSNFLSVQGSLRFAEPNIGQIPEPEILTLFLLSLLFLLGRKDHARQS